MTDINQQKRQGIYDHIRESLQEEFILSEMKRLGFWDESEEKPQLAEALIKEFTDQRNQLHELLKEKRLLENHKYSFALGFAL